MIKIKSVYLKGTGLKIRERLKSIWTSRIFATGVFKINTV